jgi:L-serine/L-threonine ammonia-lyase
LRACVAFVDLMQVMVEPACGAALAPVMVRADMLPEYAKRVLVVACGGASARYEDFMGVGQDRR